jgi:hypothetical protein
MSQSICNSATIGARTQLWRPSLETLSKGEIFASDAHARS